MGELHWLVPCDGICKGPSPLTNMIACHLDKCSPIIYQVWCCLLTFSYLLKNTFLCFPDLTWWLNLITHTLLCPIVCELHAPYDSVMSRQLAWVHWLLWIVWTLILSLNYSQWLACSHRLRGSLYCSLFHVCGWGWRDNSHYMLDVVHPLRRGPNRGCEWRCYKLHGVMEFRRSSEGMCHSQCLPTCLHFHSLQHSDFVLVVLSFTRFCSAQKWT
jgi:hypothetical protein